MKNPEQYKENLITSSTETIKRFAKLMEETEETYRSTPYTDFYHGVLYRSYKEIDTDPFGKELKEAFDHIEELVYMFLKYAKDKESALLCIIKYTRNHQLNALLVKHDPDSPVKEPEELKFLISIGLVSRGKADEMKEAATNMFINVIIQHTDTIIDLIHKHSKYEYPFPKITMEDCNEGIPTF